MDRFREQNGCGLEVLALRRSYGHRRQGSLADVAEAIYLTVQAGESDLTRRLNLNRPFQALTEVSDVRVRELEQRKEAALDELWELMNAANHHEDTHATGIYVRPFGG